MDDFCFFRGIELRKDHGKLGVFCATFPDIPVVAMTATASLSDAAKIQESLGLKKVIGNPDRTNIFYKKIFRSGRDIDAIESILRPIAKELLTSKLDLPLTIVYLPLPSCGFAYRLSQFYPTSNIIQKEYQRIACLHCSMHLKLNK